MLLPRCVRQFFSKTGCVSIVGLLSLSVVHSVMSAAPAQTPLFVTLPVKPVMMLNMSNDHQLFFKAYDDYSDITGDGNVDTSYVHSYDYYGYFDSSKCYVYSGGRFAPQKDETGGKYCSNKWSGNFLNWATMTRMDAVRKILYGGYRHIDTATETVLERALLPNDAHSFTKYYNGPDLARLTPSTVSSGVPMEKPETEATGITICNTTNPSNRSQYSQNVTDAPQMMVAKGNYSFWASNERWQCRWGQGANGNDSEETGIYAYGASPTTSARLGDFNVRVKVCVSQELVGEEKCQAYGSRLKPTGLLQKFGANGGILFGLITGSYGKNKSGGALRKNIGLISDEIKEDGTFKVPASGNSIIKTLDLLKIYGYNYSDGVYNSGDSCNWALTSFNNGSCSNWGNPQAEIYLESLRYLAGRSQKFAVDDSSRIAGLKTAAWVKPITNDNYCAPLNVLQFNASTTSYDGDVAELANNTGDIGLASVSSATNIVGANEGIHGGTFLVGQTAGNNDKLCTPKTVGSLSEVKGTCPDAPRLEGTYQIAGIAHHARSEGIVINGVSEANKKQVVRTFGVALAPAVPKIEIPVPGKDTQKITILPACRNHLHFNQTALTGTPTNCAIVDFKVFDSETTEVNGNTVNSGKLYVNWEDSEQGGDYDQDMWGIINYEVSANDVTITTQVIAQSTGDAMGFGYVITGTESDDGFQVHSGANGFRYGASCSTAASCTCHASGGTQTCNLSNPTSKTYAVGTSAASTLEQPLYYAAKWGGYSKALQEEAEKEGATSTLNELIEQNNAADSYFFATNPRDLETALEKAFQQILEQAGTASSVATNSTRLVEGANFYQALFDAKDWSGVLKSMVRSGGDWVENNSTANNLGGSRKILTANEARTALVGFEWGNLSDWQKEQLLDEEIEGDDAYNNAADERAKKRIEWIKGTTIAGDGVITRATRTKLLGDIVNSSPVFSGNKSPRYSQLPGAAGSSYANYDKKNSKAIFVGANDGMLHAFDADTLNEIFAYIPTAVYPKLAQITRPDYGTAANQHQFLVDGSLYVGDAYLNGGWKTILFGSLGAGGRSVFALDVTNPLAPTLLFELDQSDYPQLGYVLGQPAIVPLANGRWAAVFGNGYDASTSHLFVIDLENPLSPTHSRVIDTGAGTGLSTPALLPNRYGQIEYAYAGDLKGNLWKFDLSSNTPSEWDISYGKPLFQAKDKNGRPQPITGGITLGVNDLRDSAIMVYFGTGKYFEPGDNAVYNAAVDPQHSFYALVDVDGGITYTGRDQKLHKKTISGAGNTRTVTGEMNKITTGDVVTYENAVDWSAKDGWYMDFPIGGERVITKPVLLMDRLIFNTVIPSQLACDYGGSSWALELVAVGDKRLGHSVMGESATALDELVVGESGIMTGKGGEDVGDKGIKLDCNVLGNCESHEMIFWDGWRGRMNWREIR